MASVAVFVVGGSGGSLHHVLNAVLFYAPLVALSTGIGMVVASYLFN